MDFSKLIESKKIPTDVKNFLENPFKKIPDIETAIEISKKYKVSLHPRYLLYWNEYTPSELIEFFEFLKKIKREIKNNKIEKTWFPCNKYKKYFENLAIEHKIESQPIDKVKSEEEANIIILNALNSKILLSNLGFDFNNMKDSEDFKKHLDKIIKTFEDNLSKTSCEVLTMISPYEIRDKGGTYIGARMGRPEKAKMRKQFNDETRSHGLFPVGEGEIIKTKRFGSDEEHTEIISNRLKNIVSTFKHGYVEENFKVFYCENCKEERIYSTCLVCGQKAKQKYFEKYTSEELKEEKEGCVYYKKIRLDMNAMQDHLRKLFGPVEYPKHVKGISSTINKHHTTEHISKSFLRAMNNVYVNKDGTVRFDMIEMGLTHFRPKEIGTSIEKLKEIGYTHDYLGNPLENENQLLEMMPQDVILPDCIESGDELASDYVINTGNYVDDLLEKLYGLERYYNFKTKEDTVGHLIIGLAPHTSAGIVGRIIGYSKTQGCFSHPVWHAAQRRNLDGDENGIMLLMDGLVNFSRDYLPDRRGSRTMDVSLVLTSHLYLDQIDDEVHGMDIVDHYPLEFYRAAKEYASPKSVKIEKVEKRINEEDTDTRYLGYKFTHDTDNMNDTVMCSSYKSVPSMTEKMDLQLGLGKKIRAVDEHQVGSFIIDKHFMKDIKGNLRKFSMQTFRCTKCNTKFRRPPLNGKCTHCNNPSINFTISEGSIKKYLIPSFKIVEEYDVDPYIAETLELTNLRVEGVFGKELEKQKDLSGFFGK